MASRNLRVLEAAHVSLPPDAVPLLADAPLPAALLLRAARSGDAPQQLLLAFAAGAGSASLCSVDTVSGTMQWSRILPPCRCGGEELSLALARQDARLVSSCACGEIVAVPLPRNSASGTGDENAGTKSQAITVCEPLGSIAEGLCAAVWSPDARLLLLVTAERRVVLLTASFDIAGETALPAAPAVAAAAAARIPSVTTNAVGAAAAPALAPAVAWKSANVAAAWRADSSLVALAAPAGPSGDESLLCILTMPDCTLVGVGRHADGSPVRGLHARALAWNSDGTLVAMGQTLASGDVQVALFEANGLRHGEFSLTCTVPASILVPAPQVQWLSWSGDGEVLAVQLSCADSAPSLQLWTRDNYRWQRKLVDAAGWSEVGGGGDVSRDSSCVAWWDASEPLRLHAVTCRGSDSGRSACVYSTAQLAWEYSVSDSACAAVAVVDGECLRFTPLGMSRVPPPMCFSSLRLPPSAIVDDVVVIGGGCGDRRACGPVDARFAALVRMTGSAAQPSLLLASVTFSHGHCAQSAPHALAGNVLRDPLLVGELGDTGCMRVGGWASFLSSPSAAAVDESRACVISLADCFGGSTTDSSEGSRLLQLRQLTHLGDITGVGADFGSLFAVVATLRAPNAFAAHDELVFFLAAAALPDGGCILAHTRLMLSAASGESPCLSRLVALPQPAGDALSSSLVSLLGRTTAWEVDVAVEPTSSPLRLHAAARARLCVLPEPCETLLPLPGLAPEGGTAIVALSARGARLYLHGATLLSPAASSPAFSRRHGSLLFVTLGPQPRLVTIHASALAAALRCGGDAAAAAAALAAADAGAPPRALEHGSRIVVVGGGAGDAGVDEEFGADAGNAVLMQVLPRGNTETVHPRALLLAAVRAALDSPTAPDLGSAMELCRRHRVDMNILYDHAPELFAHTRWLADVAVPQVARAAARATAACAAAAKIASSAGADRWDLLLSALDTVASTAPGGRFPPPPHARPSLPAAASGALGCRTAALEDIAPAIRAFDAGLAPSLLAAGAWPPAASGEAKLRAACAWIRLGLLTAMLVPAAPSAGGAGAASSKSNLTEPFSTSDHAVINWRHPLSLSVITSYAREAPAALESMLRVVQEVAGAAVGAGASTLAAALSPPLVPLAADAALAHATALADGNVELLFATALGMYDLRLALTLAQRSQMDPQEFLPLLYGMAKLGSAKDGDGNAGSVAASAGTLQRLAIDVHLGRWPRAAAHACRLAAEAVASGVGGTWSAADIAAALAIPAEEAARRVLASLQGVGAGANGDSSSGSMKEVLIAAAQQEPLRLALALVGEHGAHEAMLSELTAARVVAGAATGADDLLSALACAVRRDGIWAQLASDVGAPSGGAAANDPEAAPASPLETLLARAAPQRVRWRVVLAALATPAGVRAAASAARALISACSPPAVVDAAALWWALAASPAALLAASTSRSADAGAAAGVSGATSSTSAEDPWERARALSAMAASGFPAESKSSGWKPPSVEDLARDAAARLRGPAPTGGFAGEDDGEGTWPPPAQPLPVLSNERRAALLAAAAAYAASPLGDVETAALCWCEAGAWAAARAAATAAGRNDLWQTTIQASILAIAAGAASECKVRAEALMPALAALRTARERRAAMPLRELLGEEEAARHEAALRAAVAAASVASAAISARDGATDDEPGAGYDDDAPAGGDDGGADEDGWSDASSAASVDSSAHPWGGRGGGGGGGGGGGSSTRSSVSRATAASSGRFSHMPASALPTTLVDRSSSLRLASGAVTPAEAAVRDAAMAANYAGRKEWRRGITLPGDGSNAGGAGGGAGGGSAGGVGMRQQRLAARRERKTRRARPGSAAEEAALELALSQLLPSEPPGWLEAARGLAAQLHALSCSREAAALAAAFGLYIAAVHSVRRAMTGETEGTKPLPPRRDGLAEAAAARRAAASGAAAAGARLATTADGPAAPTPTPALADGDVLARALDASAGVESL